MRFLVSYHYTDKDSREELTGSSGKIPGGQLCLPSSFYTLLWPAFQRSRLGWFYFG